MNQKAICLFSGGLDSTTALYFAREEGFNATALTLDYGQLHRRELECAKKIAGFLGMEHEILSISLPWGGSALLDRSIPVPKSRLAAGASEEIPSTYVPARNTIFLSFACSFAEARGAESIWIGANALDYSGYPDCRPEYFDTFEELIEKGTKAGSEGRRIQIRAPLLYLKKSEIITLGQALGVPFEWTWSCYEGGEVPCGACDACQLRTKGFREAGREDPFVYRRIR